MLCCRASTCGLRTVRIRLVLGNAKEELFAEADALVESTKRIFRSRSDAELLGAKRQAVEGQLVSRPAPLLFAGPARKRATNARKPIPLALLRNRTAKW